MSIILWKAIPSAPLYEVSTTGVVRRKVAPINGIGSLRVAPYEINQHPHKDGYLTVIMFNQGKRIRKPVHILVLEAFKCARPVGAVARHLNGINTDNSANNLIWGTQKENIHDKWEHGTMACGERAGMAKLTAAQVLSIRAEHTKVRGSRTNLARKYKVSPQAVGQILSRKHWAHV